MYLILPFIKCCLKRDDKTSRAESKDDGSYEGIFQLALLVGGINLKSDKFICNSMYRYIDYNFLTK